MRRVGRAVVSSANLSVNSSVTKRAPEVPKNGYRVLMYSCRALSLSIIAARGGSFDHVRVRNGGTLSAYSYYVRTGAVRRSRQRLRSGQLRRCVQQQCR